MTLADLGFELDIYRCSHPKPIGFLVIVQLQIPVNWDTPPEGKIHPLRTGVACERFMIWAITFLSSCLGMSKSLLKFFHRKKGGTQHCQNPHELTSPAPVSYYFLGFEGIEVQESRRNPSFPWHFVIILSHCCSMMKG